MVDGAGSEALRLRTGVLRKFGATDEQLDGLLAYTATAYGAIDPALIKIPLSDEPHLEAWREYADDAAHLGAFAALLKRFVELRFPVRAGISAEEAYRTATRGGDFAAAEAFAPGVTLEDPDGLELHIHQSIAGRIPVIIPVTRADFVTLVQAFTERNEPVSVPDSMGACMINGLKNWDRIASYRRRWYERQGADATEEGWAAELKRVAENKPLYQDRFIVLSRGPYSATCADEAGMPHDEWIRRSIAIRREHECVHYLTYRLSGRIRSNVLDELVADFAGLVAGTGQYSRELAIRFLGLHRNGELPEGSRLRAYRGSLSDAQLDIVAALARRATAHLQTCAARWGDQLADVTLLSSVVLRLMTVSIEELAEGIVPLPDGAASE